MLRLQLIIRRVSDNPLLLILLDVELGPLPLPVKKSESSSPDMPFKGITDPYRIEFLV